ncbi:MAG: phosphoenolpyruvate--protein phosphotransferase [Ignavibacteriales bacterium]|nr:phosphoenolpyruvate--protein phosphotransferase [Ignavibacteriales bacterium]
MTEPKRPEITLKGIPASPGIAKGPVYLFRKHEPIVEERTLVGNEVEKEISRLEQSIARSKKELRKIYDFAEKKLGNNQAKILEAQLLILDDAIIFGTVFERVRKEKKNAEFVVQDEIGKYHRLMIAAKDEYTRERANDLEDVRNRILRNLQEQRLVSKFEGANIVVAPNLSAADTLILSRNEVLAFATEIGGSTSHSVLLARAMQIPTVVGLPHVAGKAHEGDTMILDGYSGMVIINPTEGTVHKYERKQKEYKDFEDRLSVLRELPAETLDGHRVQLAANIELQEELEFVKMQGADGVGLYRSEVLLLGKEVFPTEQEQVYQYKILAEALHPKQVIIRTFDIGGDKLMMQTISENNPFLGWRGIRVMLDKEDLFLDQLRAILRASTRKNVAVMFPMISSIKEVRSAKKHLEEAKRQLKAKDILFDENIKVGVMVEVPSAAVIAEDLAQEVDFLSIGTNDLIQYLLAVDRSNEIVSSLYQEFHPAVVRFLRRIIERGKKGDVWVGMCGEMAGDPLATMLLLGLGLDEFSVVPTTLPEIKKIIRSVHFTEAKHIAEKVLTMQTEDEIKSYLQRIMKEKFPDIPTG